MYQHTTSSTTTRRKRVCKAAQWMSKGGRQQHEVGLGSLVRAFEGEGGGGREYFETFFLIFQVLVSTYACFLKNFPQ